jgi:acetylornithine/succinyldiaminopimelate/putrescine aminotransferase
MSPFNDESALRAAIPSTAALIAEVVEP